MLSYFPKVTNVENILALDEIWTRISFDSHVQAPTLTTTPLHHYKPEKPESVTFSSYIILKNKYHFRIQRVFLTP